MYWSSRISGTIKKSSLNGDQTEEIVTRLQFPTDIALNKRSREIYWVEKNKPGKDKIGQANLDGTNVIDLITNVNIVSTIAIISTGPYDVSSDINKLTATWANIKVR